MDEHTHIQLNYHLRTSPKKLGKESLEVQSCQQLTQLRGNNIQRSSWKTRARREEKKSASYLSLLSVPRETCSPNIPSKRQLLLNAWSGPGLSSVWVVELQPLELCLCQKYFDTSLNKTRLKTSLYNLQKSSIHSSKMRLLCSYQKSKINQVNTLRIQEGCRFMAVSVYITTNR